jgi:hypothetical protein
MLSESGARLPIGRLGILGSGLASGDHLSHGDIDSLAAKFMPEKPWQPEAPPSSLTAAICVRDAHQRLLAWKTFE